MCRKRLLPEDPTFYLAELSTKRYLTEPAPKHHLADKAFDVTYLTNTFAFSHYLYWLKDRFIPANFPNASVSSIHANTQYAEIGFNNSACRNCGDEVIATIDLHAQTACITCSQCGEEFNEKVEGKPFSPNCGESINHGFEETRANLLLLIKDRFRRKVREGGPVQIEECNNRILPTKLSQALGLKEYGLACLFWEMYRKRLYYVESAKSFFVWDGKSWVKQTFTWIMALVSTQLIDQIRWYR